MASRRLQVVLDLDTGRYTGRMQAASSQTRQFGGVVDSSSRTLRTMGSSFDSLNNKMSTPLDKLRDYVLVLGNIRLAILNVRDIAVGWIGSLIQQSAQVERLTVLMRGLSDATTEIGKSQEAADNLRFLFQEARRTGFEVKMLADSFVKMKAGGVENTTSAVSSLSDAVAHFGGTSDVMHRASIAIQQMSGKGVISMEELRQQLGEAVPTAMADMARAAGMSVKTFTDLVGKGVVQAGPALELMFREFEMRYAGAGERMAGTLTGQMAQMRTNLMELSNSFTGFDIESGKAKDGGVYAEAIKAIEKINELMRSSEGQEFARNLGEGVAMVGRGLMSVAKFIADFKTEIGVALKVVLAGFLAFKAANLLSWMAAGINNLRVRGVAAFGSLATSVSSFGLRAGESAGAVSSWSAQLARSVDGVSASYARLDKIQAARIQRTGQEMIGAKQRVTSLAEEANGLRGLSATYAQNIQILDRQHASQVRHLNTARTLHQANIATGRSSTNSLAAMSQASANLNRTTQSLNTNRRLLAVTNGQLIITERAQKVAVDMVTASVSRHVVATTASTMAMRGMALASSLTSVAVRALSVAVNIALGPIGMIALALYAAADAAGVFESRADKATAAAARLAQGMADLEAMKTVQGRMEDNRARARQMQAEIEDGHMLVDSNAGTVAVPMTRAQIAGLQRELDAVNRQIESDQSRLRRGGDAIVRESGQANAQGLLADRTTRMTSNRAQLERYQREHPGNLQGYNALGDRLGRQNSTHDRALVTELERRRDAASAAGNTQLEMGLQTTIDAFKEGANMAEGMAVSSADLRSQLQGVGEDGATAARGLTATERAARTAATAADTARDKYANMIGGNEGDIAALEADLSGAETALARFNAEVAGGKIYADATSAEIQRLGSQFHRIDQLTSDRDWGRGMRQLEKEIVQTAEEARGLWAALSADDTGRAYEDHQRTANVRSRFAPQLEAAGDDPARLAEVNANIEKVIANLNSIDLSDATNQWRVMTEEISTSFLSEDEARQRNFEREVERQRQLLSLAVEGTEARRVAEERFNQWYILAQEQLARQSEHSTIKQARQWAQLGQNIQGSLTGALDAFVDGLGDAEFDFGEFAVSMIKDLLKIILKAMIAYTILSALGMANNSSGAPVSMRDFIGGQVSSGFGGAASTESNIGFGAGGSGATPQWGQPGHEDTAPATATFPTAHIGGIIGKLRGSANVSPSVFAKAKSYHTGTSSIGGRALRPGEVPMIGMEGEAVLTEEHQRQLRNQLGASTTQAAPQITMNIINNSNTPLTAESSEPEFNGREMIISVVVEEMQKEGPLRNAMGKMR